MRYRGKITDWKDNQGFGFVTPDGGGQKAFIHISAFSGESLRPSTGDRVTYELVADGKKRYRASNARFIGKPARLGKGSPDISSSPSTASFGMAFSFFCIALFCIALAIAVALGRLPWIAAGIYTAASIITFIAYALDKSAARNNAWRTPESTLHLLSLCCGWPGALCAQTMLRHKSRKTAFLFVFWGTVVLNCMALGMLMAGSVNTYYATLS